MNFILGLIALAVAAYLVLWIIDLLWKCYLLIAGFVVGCWNIFYGIFRFIRSAMMFISISKPAVIRKNRLFPASKGNHHGSSRKNAANSRGCNRKQKLRKSVICKCWSCQEQN